MASKHDKYRKKVVNLLCDSHYHLLYVLTGVVNAVQERIGEDIMLIPREGGEEIANLAAHVFNMEVGGELKHFIFYGIPQGDPPDLDELLRITLDVAHEIGHLILESAAGHLPNRIGIPKKRLRDVIEIECDWFAICILQMHGFLLPRIDGGQTNKQSNRKRKRHGGTHLANKLQRLQLGK